MNDFLRPYTEEEFDILFQQSGYPEIARLYCLEELNDHFNYIVNDEIAWVKDEIFWEKELTCSDIPQMINALASHLKWTQSSVREEAWMRVVRDNKVDNYCNSLSQGRSDGWARSYANILANNPKPQNIYKEVYESFFNYHYADKELEEIANGLNNNRSSALSMFLTLLLRDLEKLNLEELIKSFEIYDKLVQEGMSDIYAASYFYWYWMYSRNNEYCSIYADCVNIAFVNGESLNDARAFGEDMMDHWCNGNFILEAENIRKDYPESWAKEKFYELGVMYGEKVNKQQMSTLLKNEFRKVLHLSPTTESLTQEDKDYLKLKNILESFGMNNWESERYAYKLAYEFDDIDILPQQYRQNAALRKKLIEILET